MKLSNTGFSRFCILWSILGSFILSVILLSIGIKSWGIFFSLMAYGAVIGGLSAVIAWKCCSTPHWLRISVGMELSSLFLGCLGYAIITLFSDGWGAMLDLFSITGIFFLLYFFIFGFIPLLLPAMLCIFLINFYLLRGKEEE